MLEVNNVFKTPIPIFSTNFWNFFRFGKNLAIVFLSLDSFLLVTSSIVSYLFAAEDVTLAYLGFVDRLLIGTSNPLRLLTLE